MVLPSAFFAPLRFSTRHRLLRAAVDRVVQAHVVQAEIVAGFDRHRDFLDRIDLGVAPGPRDLHGRRLVLLRLDEIILAQAHVFALVDRRRCGTCRPSGSGTLAMRQLPSPAAQRELGAVVEQQHAVRQRPIGLDGDLGGGAFHGAQIAARIFHRVLHARPGGEMIGHADLLHARQIDHVQVVMFRSGRRRPRHNIPSIPERRRTETRDRVRPGCGRMAASSHFDALLYLANNAHRLRLETDQARA